MTDFNYKKCQLEKLEEWIHDCLVSGAVSPFELYNTIVKVAKENEEYFRTGLTNSTNFLTLLHGKPVVKCDKDDNSPECKGAWTSFWKENYYPDEYDMPPWGHSDMEALKNDKVVKWQLPIEMDGPSGEYLISFPDDLLEAAGLEEGNEVEWVDNQDGTYTLRKITRPLGMDEC